MIFYMYVCSNILHTLFAWALGLACVVKSLKVPFAEVGIPLAIKKTEFLFIVTIDLIMQQFNK